MKTHILFFVLLLFITESACNLKNDKPLLLLNTISDSVAYSVGVKLGTHMKEDKIDSLNLDILIEAIRSTLHSDSILLSPEQSQSFIQSYLAEKKEASKNLAQNARSNSNTNGQNNDKGLIGIWKTKIMGYEFIMEIQTSGENYSITKYSTNGNKVFDREKFICSFEKGCFLQGVATVCCYDEGTNTIIERSRTYRKSN